MEVWSYDGKNSNYTNKYWEVNNPNSGCKKDDYLLCAGTTNYVLSINMKEYTGREIETHTISI